MSGRVGRVTHGHLNDVFRAVEEFRAKVPGRAKPDGGRRTYVATLTTSASTTAVGGYTTWNWQGVSVASSALSADAALVQSSDFASAGGTAIDLGGAAAANDVVLLHEVVANDGKRWFAFQSGGSGGTAAFPGYLITAATADATGDTPSWVYTLQPITGITSGGWTASGSTVRARNYAEDQNHYQHGQDLTLSSGTLTPAAVQGPVNAWDTGLTEAAVALWAFDVPNPMTVACSTDVGYGDPFGFLTMGAS